MRKPGRFKPGLFGCALLCQLAASQGQALSFDFVPTLEDIAAQSQLAFRGRVLALSHGSAPVDGARTLPYTRIKLEVERGYRGVRQGETVELRQIGGPIGGDFGRYLLIPGLARFQPNDRLVIFNNDRVQPAFATLYGDRGVLRVRLEPPLKEILTTVEGRPLVLEQGRIRPARDRVCRPPPAQCDASRPDGTAPLGPPLDLAGFERRIQSLLDESPAPTAAPRLFQHEDAGFEALLGVLGRQDPDEIRAFRAERGIAP